MPVKKAGSVPARATNLKDVPRDIAGFVQALHQESELSRGEIIGISIEQKPPQWRVPEQRTDSRGTDAFRVDHQGIAPGPQRQRLPRDSLRSDSMANLKPFQSRYFHLYPVVCARTSANSALKSPPRLFATAPTSPLPSPISPESACSARAFSPRRT